MFAARLTKKILRAKTVFDDLGAMAVVQRILRRVARPVTAEGRAHTEWVKQQYIMDQQFDSAHGTDTGGIVDLFDLKIVGNNQRHGLLYAATRPDDFDLALKSLDLNFEDFTFVDLGCGKGRTLVLASNFPFRRLIGVEFAIELAEIAKKNIEAIRQTRPELDAEVAMADAATYEFPREPLVIYVWNAFGSVIVRQVADHVRLSRQQDPRPIFFVYMNPVHAREFSDEFWVQLPATRGCLIMSPR